MPEHPFPTFKLSDKLACPHCGKQLDAAMNIINRRAPKSGDCTACGYCAAFLMFVFDENGEACGYREPTIEERALLMANPDIAQTFALAQAMADRRRMRR